MTKNSLLMVAITLPLSFAHATQVHDTRSLSMAGTGVALPDIHSAAHKNPAILSSSKLENGFSLVLPSLMVGVNDDDEFIDAVDDFQDGDVVDQLESAINDIQNTGSFSDVRMLTDDLISDLENIDGKRIEATVGALGSLAIPGQTLGVALRASFSTTVGGKVNYEDSATLNGLRNEVVLFDQCIQDNMASQGSCDPNDTQWQYIDVDNGDITLDVSEDLLSSVSMKGLALAEVGLSLSTSFELKDKHIAIGVTPKMVQATVIDYLEVVNDVEVEDFDGEQYINSENDFNVDVGVFVELSDRFNIGVTGTNLISKEYKSNTYPGRIGSVVNLEPEYTAGLSYSANWITVGLDADITKNKLLNGQDSQIVAIGVELNAWDFAQLRMGYRHDLENPDLDMVSAGLGFSPLGIHVDVGVAANETHAALSLQTGFKW